MRVAEPKSNETAQHGPEAGDESSIRDWDALEGSKYNAVFGGTKTRTNEFSTWMGITAGWHTTLLGRWQHFWNGRTIYAFLKEEHSDCPTCRYHAIAVEEKRGCDDEHDAGTGPESNRSDDDAEAGRANVEGHH